MTKPAVRVARKALAVGGRSFPAYASRPPRHDFPQAHFFALLVLRRFLHTGYRGLMADWQDLRKALRLRRVPHYSALAYAAPRLLPEAERGEPSIMPSRSPWSGPGPLA